jgi:hypothetical protein
MLRVDQGLKTRTLRIIMPKVAKLKLLNIRGVESLDDSDIEMTKRTDIEVHLTTRKAQY